ncbi:arrestin-related trafficking adapter 5 [[Candida] anglica]
MFKHKHHQDPALFEIRLRSPHKNLLLIKGNEHECDRVPFQGSIKLSIPEDIHVKRIKLRLVGEYKLEYFARDNAGMVCDLISSTNCVLDIEWPNLLTDEQGELVFGDYGETVKKMSKKKSHSNGNSTTSLGGKSAIRTNESRPTFNRASSQPLVMKSGTSSASSSTSDLLQIPKSGVDGTPFKDRGATAKTSFLLPKGNYNIPFETFLPTNISETVEGLNCGHVLYRLECQIERGRFEKQFQTSKHLRIVRTLHPQNLSLSDTIDINNTWPNKVQYAVRVPKKGVAMGSTVPINILIVPIAKGLSLKGISGVLVQHYHVSIPNSFASPEFEEIFAKQNMPMTKPEDFSLDQWNIKSHFKLPSKLSEVTQTCDIKDSMIVVKHRLRISIQLLNKEGHVSELRANLPIVLYISANSGHVEAHHFDIDAHGAFLENKTIEDNLFKRDVSANHSLNNSSTNLAAENEQSSDDSSDNDADREEAAPPLYQQHMFDKIYDSTLPQTPLEQFRSQSAQASPEGSTVNLDSYFNMPRSIGEAFAMENKKNKKSSHQYSSSLDVSALCMVPSYDRAIDEDTDEESADLAPSYSNGSSKELAIDIPTARPMLPRAHTESRFSSHKRASKLFSRK